MPLLSTQSESWGVATVCLYHPTNYPHTNKEEYVLPSAFPFFLIKPTFPHSRSSIGGDWNPLYSVCLKYVYVNAIIYKIKDNPS